MKVFFGSLETVFKKQNAQISFFLKTIYLNSHVKYFQKSFNPNPINKIKLCIDIFYFPSILFYFILVECDFL